LIQLRNREVGDTEDEALYFEEYRFRSKSIFSRGKAFFPSGKARDARCGARKKTKKSKNKTKNKARK
jgi:hypothetical protein